MIKLGSLLGPRLQGFCRGFQPRRVGRSFSTLSESSSDLQRRKTGGVSKAQTLVEEIDDIARRGYLKRLNTRQLFEVWEACEPTRREYLLGLRALNILYNYGRNLDHQEVATRLLSLCIRCNQLDEAIELVKLYNTFLLHPPKSEVIFRLMQLLYEEEKYTSVFEVMSAVREDWQIPVESKGYEITINSMLKLPESGLTEAMKVYDDSAMMKISLPIVAHLSLLIFIGEELQKEIDEIILKASEVDRDDLPYIEKINCKLPEFSDFNVSALSEMFKHLTLVVKKVQDRLEAEGFSPSKDESSGRRREAFLITAWLKWQHEIIQMFLGNLSSPGSDNVDNARSLSSVSTRKPAGYTTRFEGDWKELLREACRAAPGDEDVKLLPEKFVDCLKLMASEKAPFYNQALQLLEDSLLA